MKASDITDVACENCGTVHQNVVTNEIEFCAECCEHENTEAELTGTYCMDCGMDVS